MASRTASRHVGLTPEIAFNKAVALQFQGNLGEAEKLYRAILKEHPRHVPTLFNLAAALWGAGRSGKRSVCYARRSSKSQMRQMHMPCLPGRS